MLGGPALARLLLVLRAPWLTALGPCLQFHDICFGGAPAMGAPGAGAAGRRLPLLRAALC